jgi:hypothetical protein
LLHYVEGGGNLLVTGPISRDEHWQRVDRTSAFKLNGQVTPLWYHNAMLRMGSASIPLSFSQDRQFWAEVQTFENGDTFVEVPLGKGRIYWAAFPVELAEGTAAAANVYQYVAQRVGLAPQYEMQSPVPAGVLIYPTVLDDSVLYVFASETSSPAQITLRDKLTGAQVSFVLQPERAAIALISKDKRAVIAKYGF